MTIDLTEEQALAAAESLIQETNKLFGNQPSYVVMTALAGLVGYGIAMMRDEGVSREKALCDHIDFVREWMRRIDRAVVELEKRDDA